MKTFLVPKLLAVTGLLFIMVYGFLWAWSIDVGYVVFITALLAVQVMFSRHVPRYRRTGSPPSARGAR